MSGRPSSDTRVPRKESSRLASEGGLVIELFGEPRVGEEVAKMEPALEDTLVAPIFLHIRALKPDEPPRKRGSYKLGRQLALHSRGWLEPFWNP
jgi:hypothetical protein